MGGAVGPSCFLAWDQTIVEAMVVMETSFKKTYDSTILFSAPDPAAGHSQPMPPLETPGHLQASLGQSIVGHYSFLLGLGAHKIPFVPSKNLYPQSCGSSLIKSHRLPVTFPGASQPFAGSPGWEICCES